MRLAISVVRFAAFVAIAVAFVATFVVRVASAFVRAVTSLSIAVCSAVSAAARVVASASMLACRVVSAFARDVNSVARFDVSVASADVARDTSLLIAVVLAPIRPLSEPSASWNAATISVSESRAASSVFDTMKLIWFCSAVSAAS